MRRITCVSPQLHFLRIYSLFLYQTRTFCVSLSLFHTRTRTHFFASLWTVCVVRHVLLLRLQHRLARGRKNVAALTLRNARSKLDRWITIIDLACREQNTLGFCAYSKKCLSFSLIFFSLTLSTYFSAVGPLSRKKGLEASRVFFFLIIIMHLMK